MTINGPIVEWVYKGYLNEDDMGDDKQIQVVRVERLRQMALEWIYLSEQATEIKGARNLVIKEFIAFCFEEDGEKEEVGA